MHRDLETKVVTKKPIVSNDKTKPDDKSKPTSGATKTASPSNNKIVIKPKITVDPFDILKGAGEFRYKTNEEMLKTWTFVNESNYDLTL